MGEGGRWNVSSRRLRLIALGFITLYIGGVLTIWVSAPTLPFDAYPDHCPEDSRNCTRIAPNPYRGNGEQSITLNASRGEVMDAISIWLEEQPRTEIVTSSDEVGYIHAVFRSLTWRFPDDMLFHIECENGSSVVWVHSQSRVGVYDFEVNDARVLRFSDHIQSQTWSNQTCED